MFAGVLSDCFSDYKFYVIRKLSELYSGHSEYLEKESLPNLDYVTIIERINSGNFVFFYLYDELKNCIVASYWALTPRTKSLWHDSFLIHPHKALLCNAFVNPNYRRLGLYSFLIGATHTYLLNYYKCDSVYTIVEKSNDASLDANKKFGLPIVYRQFLIKFFGVNIFSIIKNDLYKKIQIVINRK